MQQVLFRPFDIGKWLVIGFACWLARLAEGGGDLPSWILSIGSVTAGATQAQSM